MAHMKIRTTMVTVATVPMFVLAGQTGAVAAPEAAAPAAAAAVPEPGDVPAGLEERLAELPQGASTDQVVKAMYPGDAQAQASAKAAMSATPVMARGFGWGDAWKVTKCVGVIGAFIAGNALLITKASKFGGVLKGAKLIVQAGNKEERIKLLIAIFGEVTGISAVATSCG